MPLSCLGTGTQQTSQTSCIAKSTLAAMLLFVSSIASAEISECFPDPGANLDYPMIHYGTESPAPDQDGTVLFGNSVVRPERQITRAGESWLVGPYYFRGNQAYHDDQPFDAFVFREVKLDCSYEKLVAEPVPLSVQRRVDIAEYVRSRLVDPYSVREASYFAIKEHADISGRRDSALLLVCVMFNAKNSMGGYTGMTYLPFALREDGSLLKALDRAPETQAFCNKSGSWKFPELGRTD